MEGPSCRQACLYTDEALERALAERFAQPGTEHSSEQRGSTLSRRPRCDPQPPRLVQSAGTGFRRCFFAVRLGLTVARRQAFKRGHTGCNEMQRLTFRREDRLLRAAIY